LLTTSLIAAVLLLCASSNFLTDFNYGDSQAQITSVTRSNKDYNYVVSYSVNNINYTGILKDNLEDKKTGDMIQINYEKQNPKNITLYTNKMKASFYSSLIGLLFVVLSYFAYIQVKKLISRC
jgi:hypothetical protein